MCLLVEVYLNHLLDGVATVVALGHGVLGDALVAREEVTARRERSIFIIIVTDDA